MIKNKLLSNFFSLFVLQGLNFLFPLLITPYLFNVIGDTKFGIIAFALAFIDFIIIFIEYGFQLSATRDIALNINNKNKINNIVNEVYNTKLLLIFLAFIVLTLLILFIDIFSENSTLFYLFFLSLIGRSLFPIWFFQGIEEMQYISYLNIASKVILGIGVLLFIDNSSDYLLYPILYAISTISIGVYTIFLLKSKYGIIFQRITINEIRSILSKSFNIFLGELAPSLYTKVNIFLLGFFAPIEYVGYLSLSYRFVFATNSIIYIARNVTFPYLNKNFKNFKKITFFILILGFGFTSFLLCCSQFIIPILFPDKEQYILYLIYILSVSPFFYSIILSYGSNYLLVLRKDKIYKNITILSSIFGIILSIILLPLFKINAALFIIVFIQFLTSIFFLREYFLIENNKREVT